MSTETTPNDEGKQELKEKFFPENYVHELREENKSWRIKVRELEAEKGEFDNKLNSVQSEFSGLKKKQEETDIELKKHREFKENLKKELLEELTDEDSKTIGEKLELEDLKKFVQLNKKNIKVDDGKGGQMPPIDLRGRTKYDEFSFSELRVIKEKMPDLFDKMYNAKVNK